MGEESQMTTIETEESHVEDHALDLLARGPMAAVVKRALDRDNPRAIRDSASKWSSKQSERHISESPKPRRILPGSPIIPMC
jgi:hypothetical protein